MSSSEMTRLEQAIAELLESKKKAEAASSQAGQESREFLERLRALEAMANAEPQSEDVAL